MKPALARAFKAPMSVLIGGLIFWVPSVLVHWIRGARFSGFDVLGLTVLLPATTCLFFAFRWWPWRPAERRLSQALFALLGIWLFGPLMMLIGWTFMGAGFSKPDGRQGLLLMAPWFPLLTFMMSTYDGTLGALMLTTVLLPILALRSKQTVRP